MPVNCQTKSISKAHRLTFALFNALLQACIGDMLTASHPAYHVLYSMRLGQPLCNLSLATRFQLTDG